MSLKPPFRTLEWDDALETSVEARSVLAKSFLSAEMWLFSNAHGLLLNRDLLCELHRMLFADTFPFLAGRVRHLAIGFDQPIGFGGMSGVHHRDLPDQLEKWSREVSGLVMDLDRYFDEESTTRHIDDVLSVAAYTHCEVTRMHPFVNGNGRTARLCVNYFAYRYKLIPLIVERDRDDPRYIGAANDWLRYDKREPFIGYLRERMVPVQGDSN